jgi:hypothetical protein
MTIKWEFMSPLLVLYVLEGIYETVLLAPYFKAVGRRRLGSHFGHIAFGVYGSCICGNLVKWVELVSDLRLLGQCPTYPISIFLSQSEVVVYIVTIFIAARMTRLIYLGKAPSQAFDLRGRIGIFLAANIGLALPGVFVITYFKACGSPENYTAWATAELLVGAGLCFVAVLLCVAMKHWATRAATHSADNLAQFHKSWRQMSSRVAMAWLLSAPILLGVTVLQLAILVVKDAGVAAGFLSELRDHLDCVFCLVMWCVFSLTRVFVVRVIVSGDRTGNPAKSFSRWFSLTEAAVSAALLEEEGGHSLGETPAAVSAAGLKLCRAVKVSQLSADCFRPGDVSDKAEGKSEFAGADAENQTKPQGLPEAAPCSEPDFFVSHSWRDNPDAKWESLNAIAENFKEQHGREPLFWIDKYCIDQANNGPAFDISPCSSLHRARSLSFMAALTLRVFGARGNFSL